MLEIYNEVVKDLLNVKSFTKQGLRVRQDKNKESSKWKITFGLLNGGTSFRWSFGPNFAWGSIESNTILITRPSLPNFRWAYSSLPVHYISVILNSKGFLLRRFDKERCKFISRNWGIYWWGNKKSNRCSNEHECHFIPCSYYRLWSFKSYEL